MGIDDKKNKIEEDETSFEKLLKVMQAIFGFFTVKKSNKNDLRCPVTKKISSK